MFTRELEQELARELAAPAGGRGARTRVVVGAGQRGWGRARGGGKKPRYIGRAKPTACAMLESEN